MVEIVNPGRFTSIGRALEQVRKDHPGRYDTPVWGEKNTLHMKNLGFVIGYRDDSKTQWFRVDYDPNPAKGLHINWEQDTRDPSGGKCRLKECYLVRPFILSQEDEMYTWWRSATLHHCTDLPEGLRRKLGGTEGGAAVWRGAFWTVT